MRFAKNVSAKKMPNNVCWQIFNFLYSKKTSNHDLPTYDLPKRHFNNANIVFTTLPAMTNNRTVKDERRFASEKSTERLSGREAGVVLSANRDFFVQFAKLSNRVNKL